MYNGEFGRERGWLIPSGRSILWLVLLVHNDNQNISFYLVSLLFLNSLHCTHSCLYPGWTSPTLLKLQIGYGIWLGMSILGLLRWSRGKEPSWHCGRHKTLIRWLGRSYGGHCNPLQYSCMENPMDRGARHATVHRVTKGWTWLRQLRTYEHFNLFLFNL